METTGTAGIEAVREIVATAGMEFVPNLSDYIDPSAGWSEVEYRHLDLQSRRTVVGYWTGEPGSVSFDSWPYTEVCSILSGQVAVADQYGHRKTFGAGQGFIVPQGFRGTWISVESARKIFVAIE